MSVFKGPCANAQVWRSEGNSVGLVLSSYLYMGFCHQVYVASIAVSLAISLSCSPPCSGFRGGSWAFRGETGQAPLELSCSNKSEQESGTPPLFLLLCVLSQWRQPLPASPGVEQPCTACLCLGGKSLFPSEPSAPLFCPGKGCGKSQR